MRKILILSNSSSGLYEFRKEVLSDLLSDSEVYVSLPESDEYTVKMEELGCSMILTRFERRGMNPIKDLGLLREYLRLIKTLKPDIVCTYTIKPNIYGGLASRLSRVPYICNITGLGTAIQNGGVLSKVLIQMYRTALLRAKCVFFQNEYNRDFMIAKGVAKTNSRMLPGSGVNLSEHDYKGYPSEDDGIRILSVLRIMQDKGIEELIESIDEYGSDRVRFVLAGKYEEETRQKYEPEIERLIRENKLEYLGYVGNMNPVYEFCHMVVHPSYHEGLSNVCLEAAAIGRPVLTSDVPGCRETVIDGESGILFESQSKEALKEALGIMLTKKTAEDRCRMGQAGREHVRNTFDRQIVVRRYREVIEE